MAHEYPERIVELHFFRCDLLDEPRPVLGQEMRWVARTEPRLDFPRPTRTSLRCLCRIISARRRLKDRCKSLSPQSTLRAPRNQQIALRAQSLR